MPTTLPQKAEAMLDWSWDQYEPHGQKLLDQPLAAANMAVWLADWTRLTNLVHEVSARLRLANTQDTTDAVVEARFFHFVGEVLPAWQALNQQLKIIQFL